MTPGERMLARFDRERWNDFLRIWQVVAISMLVQHNLLVIAHAPTIEARERAAFEVATTIGAVFHVAMSGGQP